jgi:hypothetical protein
MVFQGSNEEIPPLPASYLKQGNGDGDEEGEYEGDEEEEEVGEVVGSAGESAGGGGGGASLGNSEAAGNRGEDGSNNGKEKRKRSKKKKGAKWSEKAASAHSWVYVENLPPDANENEVQPLVLLTDAPVVLSIGYRLEHIFRSWRLCWKTMIHLTLCFTLVSKFCFPIFFLLTVACFLLCSC